MATVSLQRVRKVYEDGFVAVHGVDLDVDEGEFVVLVGPSGCGKSTTLRMIAGLETISDGTLRIGGRVVNDVPPAERDIAMVFQSYALYPHMTVRDNLGFALRLQKRPKEEVDRRVRAAAATLGLDTMLDRTPKQLSGGQRQRVAIGRAIVREPQVFLFDEPLSNLDAKLRGQMRREIAALHRRVGATSVYVTHDQVEAMTLGDRIVVMSAGRVQQIDTPAALYDRPANTFVASFLGSPPMNLLRGALHEEGGAWLVRLDGVDAEVAVPASVASRAPARSVVLGVRPEHVGVAREGAADGRSSLSLTLELAEPLGHEVLVHAARGDMALTARVAPQPLPAPGAAMTFTLDAVHVHLFDAESGARI